MSPPRSLLRFLAGAVLSAAALAPIAARCAEAKERISLSVFGLPLPSSANPNDVAELHVIAEFRKRHPEIDLQSASGLKIEGLGSEIGPLMMIAGGIAPDVLYLNFRMLDTYVRQGLVLPLDDFIASPDAGADGWSPATIPAQIADVIHVRGPDGQVHCYGLPTHYLVTGLYYNRSVFRQAGLPMRAPRDWAELEEFCQKIDALDPSNKGLVLNSGQQAAWNLMNFLWSAGGDAVRKAGTDDWRAVFDTDQAVDAFEYYYRLTEGEHLAYREDIGSLLNTAESRHVGMCFGYIGDTVSMDMAAWGFGAVPAGPGGLSGSELNAPMMGIFSGVKDPRVRKAAWEYISFSGSEEAQRIRVATLVEMGMSGQVNPVDLRRFGYVSLLELAEPGLEDSVRRAMANGHPEPHGRNCSTVYVEMTRPLDRILLDGTIADAWARGDRAAVRARIGAILRDAAAQTNERMLGVVSPETMRKRRLVVWLALAVGVAIFAGIGRAIFPSLAAIGRATERTAGGRTGLAWALLAVPIALALAWSFVPIARGAWMALLDYRIVLPSVFVGVDNFADVLFDGRFWASMLATFHFAFWMLTVGFGLPVLLAYLLHLAPRGKFFFRTVYYLPALLTGTAVYVLWKQFLGAHGLVNEALNQLGLPLHRAWPDDPRLAMLSAVLPAVWAGAGPGCLIYLAALKTIPAEQFEAAEIDGASFWAKSRHIVFPALAPLLLINFVGAVMAAFQASQNVLIMTAGGPNGITEVAALRIFYQAFLFLNFGPATAMAWVLGSLLIGFALLQLQRLGRMEFKGR